MNDLSPEELLTYILAFASDNGIPLTELRLVKFVYLADLYVARERRKTVTGWPWFFYNYGPYCLDVSSALRSLVERGVVFANQRPSRYDEEDTFTQYSCKVTPAQYNTIEKKISVRVQSALCRDIKRFGRDSHSLLNYVYFETEPMHGATKGDILDFTTASWPEVHAPSALRPFTKAEMSKARELVARITYNNKHCQRVNVATPIFDEAYEKALEFFDCSHEIDPALHNGIAPIIIEKKKKIG